MEVHLNPDVRAKVDQWSAEAGRPVDELVEDAVVGFFAELAQVRGMLDRRYDAIRNGEVKPIDGEAFFERLREREEEMLHRRSAT